MISAYSAVRYEASAHFRRTRTAGPPPLCPRAAGAVISTCERGAKDGRRSLQCCLHSVGPNLQSHRKSWRQRSLSPADRPTSGSLREAVTDLITLAYSLCAAIMPAGGADLVAVAYVSGNRYFVQDETIESAKKVIERYDILVEIIERGAGAHCHSPARRIIAGPGAHRPQRAAMQCG
jgi:hypothetical protein